MRWRVVFDTNVMISGLLWRGAPYRCVQLARSGVVEAVWCTEMLDELSTKLVSKFGFSGNRLAETIEDWRRRTTEISIRGDLCVVEADPDDDVFVECAVRSGARFIVSGDRHLLKLGEYGATKVITATALLDVV